MLRFTLGRTCTINIYMDYFEGLSHFMTYYTFTVINGNQMVITCDILHSISLLTTLHINKLIKAINNNELHLKM